MQSYQYSLLRYRHDRTAGEFANIGVVMLVNGEQRVLHAMTHSYRRLAQFFAGFNAAAYRRMVSELQEHFDAVIRAWNSQSNELHQASSGENEFDSSGSSNVLEELRRKLVPADESCFRWSDVMSGVHPQPEARFEELYYEFIGRSEVRSFSKVDSP